MEDKTTDPGCILVVDDSRTNRLKLSRVLKQQGHQVTLAENGHEALKKIREDAYDLMLLDIVMPEMDGYEVLGKMRRDNLLLDVPVIVISSVDGIESSIRCIELGAEDYLPKPFDPVLLKARIGAVLEKKQLRKKNKPICSS